MVNSACENPQLLSMDSSFQLYLIDIVIYTLALEIYYFCNKQGCGQSFVNLVCFHLFENRCASKLRERGSCRSGYPTV